VKSKAKPRLYAADTASPHAKQSLRLWLRMLGTTTIIEKTLRSRLKAGCNTTLPRFDVLAALDRESGPVTMSRLSDRLLVSNGNVTGLVSRLVEGGLVERNADPDDRRTLYVSLTAKGRKAFAAMAAHHELWVDEMFESVSDRDMKTLLTLVTQLYHDVHDRMESIDAP